MSEDMCCQCGMAKRPPPNNNLDEQTEVALSEPGTERDDNAPLRFDIHSHILPKQWPSLSEKYGEGPWLQLHHHKDDYAQMMKGGKFFREVYKNCWDSETRLKECDEYKIDVQVLSTVPVMFSYWAKPEHTLDLSRYLNDNIAQTCSENPRRYAGLGTVPMQSTELAVKELRRLHEDLGLQGIEIGTNVLGKNLDHPDIFPLLEECSDMGACIFVHPWDMIGMERMPDYWLPWLVAMPAETSLAICSMIFGGVFERLPNLRVCFSHGGGSFPGTLGRVEQGFRVRPDLCAVKNDVNPREYCGKFWLDSLTHDQVMLENNVKLWGSDRIMLGTDYPFPLGEFVTTSPGKLIEKTFPNGPDIKMNIFEKSALEFLGVDKERFERKDE